MKIQEPATPDDLMHFYGLTAERKWSEALALAPLLVERYPFCSQLWLSYGNLLYLASEEATPDDVAKCFLIALKFSPEDPCILEDLAHHYHAFDELEKSVEFAQRYVNKVAPVLEKISEILTEDQSLLKAAADPIVIPDNKP